MRARRATRRAPETSLARTRSCRRTSKRWREAATGDGDKATRAFADEAVHAGGLTDQQRDALRTLAAARHSDRAQGIGLAYATSPLGDGGQSDGGGAAGPADAGVDEPVGSTGGAVTDEPLDSGGGGAATAAQPPAPPVLTDQPLEQDAARSPGPPVFDGRPLEQGPPQPSPPPFTGRPDEE